MKRKEKRNNCKHKTVVCRNVQHHAYEKHTIRKRVNGNRCLYQNKDNYRNIDLTTECDVTTFSFSTILVPKIKPVLAFCRHTHLIANVHTR